jgi:quinol monooxygenase YgiN
LYASPADGGTAARAKNLDDGPQAVYLERRSSRKLWHTPEDRMAASSYTVVATFHVRAEALGAMKQFVADVTGPCLGEDGGEVYHWSQGADDPTQFLLYMEWRDRASFEAHVASPHVQRAEELLSQGMLVEPATERHYERI